MVAQGNHLMPVNQELGNVPEARDSSEITQKGVKWGTQRNWRLGDCGPRGAFLSFAILKVELLRGRTSFRAWPRLQAFELNPLHVQRGPGLLRLNFGWVIAGFYKSPYEMAWPYYPTEEFVFKGKIIMASRLGQVLLKVWLYLTRN